jgi:hypothetical protein
MVTAKVLVLVRPPVSRPARVTTAGPFQPGGSVTVPRQLPSDRRVTASGRLEPPVARIVAHGAPRNGSTVRKITANVEPARGVTDEGVAMKASAVTVLRRSVVLYGLTTVATTV